MTQYRKVITQAASKIAALDTKLRTATGDRPLEFYRAAGEVINRLPTGYANYRFSELAAALEKLGIPGTGTNNLHKMAHFAKETSASEFHTLDHYRVSWRVASALTNSNLDVRQRRSLLRQLKTGKIEPEQLGKKITSSIKPSARTGTKSVEKAYKRAGEAVKHLRVAETHSNEEVKKLAKDNLANLRQLVK